jgi:FK506-binding nuclear protein
LKKKSRFEEVEDEESSKAQKRRRESDAADTPTESKKKSKKLKSENGKSIAVETDAVQKDEKTEKGKKEKKDKKERKKADDTPGEKPTPAKTTIAGGVVIEDALVGTGPIAKKGNTVRMRYIGKLTNGKVFDKNTSGKPVCRFPVSMVESDPFSVHFQSRKGRSYCRLG